MKCILFIVGFAMFIPKIYSASNEKESIQAFSPFPFGVYLTEKYANLNEMYMTRAGEEFGSVTTGGMKMMNIRPSEDVYDYSFADHWVNYAQEQNKRLHGHLLIWGKVPDWLAAYPNDSALWEQVMKEHIQTVVKHYKGRVASWDVVGEAINDQGILKPENPWYVHLGPGYVERAFIYAHEADPDALLFYNDYGHEYANKRLNGIVNMLKDMKARGIPVHGIGLQMHTRWNLGDERWRNAIKVSASTGLKVHISELDVSINKSEGTHIVITPELAKIQKQKYRYIVRAYNELPDEQKFGITVWGIGDIDSWIKEQYPLLFDNDYRKKPAYYGVLEGFVQPVSLCFDKKVNNSPKQYVFNSGDVMHFSTGRNTYGDKLCPGYKDDERAYRISEHTFTLNLVSTSMESIRIYAKGEENKPVNFSKIEIADEEDGVYTDITENVYIGDASSTLSSKDCGIVYAENLDAPLGSFVRFTITYVNDNTPAPINISELLVFPIATFSFEDSTDVADHARLSFGKTESAVGSYTFPSGDIMYFSTTRNTNTKDVCEGFEYRVQESAFILKLVSTSLDSIRVNGIAGSTVPRNIKKIEISTEKNGPYEDITNRVSIGPDVLYSSCRSLIAGNIGAPLGSFVRFTIMRTDQEVPDVVNFFINELELYPMKDISTGNVISDVEKPIRSRKFYSAAGVEVKEVTNGFFIEKTEYYDGSFNTRKILNTTR